MSTSSCFRCNGVQCRDGRDCPLRGDQWSEYEIARIRARSAAVPPLHVNRTDSGRIDAPSPLTARRVLTLDRQRREGAARRKAGRWFLVAGLLAGFLAGWTARGHAAELHLAVHGLSHHFGERKDGGEFNERNWGLGVRAKLHRAIYVQASRARNSYGRWSWYAAGDWTPLAAGRFSAGVFAGVTNNYPIHRGGWVPAGGALVRWQGDRASVTVRAVPPVSDKTDGAVLVEAGWRFL